LATRPLLTQHDRTAIIEAYDVERVLPNIDTNYGDRILCCCSGPLESAAFSRRTP
jgi:hypothetical protein